MAEAATVDQPLTAEESATLDKLLARASAGQGPGTRIGEPYVALTWLSVPRRSDKDRQTDLVPPGETVYLTQDEARAFQRRDPGRDGRVAPVIRKLSGADGTREPLGPRVVPNGAYLLPRLVSGRMRRPAMPPPGDTGPRPDLEGSSEIQVFDDRVPESGGAASADPSETAAHLTAPAEMDAIDLPPARNRSRAR